MNSFVAVHTSLPPYIQEPTRFILTLYVKELRWTISKEHVGSFAKDPVSVRVLWWGEESEGAIFKPRVANLAGYKQQTLQAARYYVNVPIEQFIAYLRDMNALFFDVIHANKGTLIGRCLLDRVERVFQDGLLRNMVLPILDHERVKIGELTVSLTIKEFSDSSSMDQNSHPTNVEANTKASNKRPPVAPSGNSKKLSKTIPSGKSRQIASRPPVNSLENPPGNGFTIRGSSISPQSSQPLHDVATLEMIEEVVARGRRLREAIACDMADEEVLTAVDKKLLQTDDLASGDLHDDPDAQVHAVRQLLSDSEDLPANTEMRLVQLVTKNQAEQEEPETLRALQYLLGQQRQTHQLSDSDDALPVRHRGKTGHISEEDDPVKDEQLMHELFFKQPESNESALSDSTADDGRSSRTGSLKSKLTNTSVDSRSRSRRRARGSQGKGDSRSASPGVVRQASMEVAKAKSAAAESYQPSGSASVPRRRKIRRQRSSASSNSNRSSVSFDPEQTEEDTKVKTTANLLQPQVGTKSLLRLSQPRLRVFSLVTYARLQVNMLRLLNSVASAARHNGLVSRKMVRSRSPSLSPQMSGKPPPSPRGSFVSASGLAKSFIIEYRFPVSAPSRDDDVDPTATFQFHQMNRSSNKDPIIAMEKHRIEVLNPLYLRSATDSTSAGARDVDMPLQHTSRFPLQFNATVLDTLWDSAVLFKLFALFSADSVGGQPEPCVVELGMCQFPLKKLLLSDGLLVNLSLPIYKTFPTAPRQSRRKTRSSSSGTNPEPTTDPPRVLLGSLSLCLELGSGTQPDLYNMEVTRLQYAETKEEAAATAVAQVPARVEPTTRHQDSLPSKVTETSTVNRHAAESRGPNRAPRVSPAPEAVSKATVSNIPEYSQSEPSTLYSLLIISHGRNFLPPRPTAPDQRISTGAHLSNFPSARAISLSGSLVGGGSQAGSQRCNPYLIVRQLWVNDVQRSQVAWGASSYANRNGHSFTETQDPSLANFQFLSRAPFLLNENLLSRLKDNFSVVEVWNKSTTAEKDQWLGLVKLPLHQFYLSFAQDNIRRALMKSQYPVVAVDQWLPIRNVILQEELGQLRVLLAMGSWQQIMNLEQERLATLGIPVVDSSHMLSGTATAWGDVGGDSRNKLETTNHNMDQLPLVEDVEYAIEIGVERLVEFNPVISENFNWGDCDCFVQYFFPKQTNEVMDMATFRTTSTLLVPQTAFHDVTRHRFFLPLDGSLQRELVKVCASAGTACVTSDSEGEGGVPFELWIRQYASPHVVDRVLARGVLPLGKLCGLVTLHRVGLQPSQQVLRVPLHYVDTQQQRRLAAQLEVSITFRSHHVTRPATHLTTKTSIPGSGSLSNNSLSHVVLCVELLSACGLQRGSKLWSLHSVGMEYAASAGVNVYARCHLSWLMSNEGNGAWRRTRTVPRTFAPEFAHNMEIPCPLLFTSSLSLAERMMEGFLYVEVYHQVPAVIRDLPSEILTTLQQNHAPVCDVTSRGDVLLGWARLPLSRLLYHRSGGLSRPVWLSLQAPEELQRTLVATGHGAPGVSTAVGAVELSLRFGEGAKDRSRVLRAAVEAGYLLPWVSPQRLLLSGSNRVYEKEDLSDELEWLHEDEFGCRYKHVNVNVEMVEFPVKLLKIAQCDELELPRSTTVFLRYRLYNRDVVCTRPTKVAMDDMGLARLQVAHERNFCLKVTPALLAYFRESELEVQLWCRYTSCAADSRDGEEEELQEDQHHILPTAPRLIGTAFVALHRLVEPTRRQHRLVTTESLWKRGAADMGGASVALRITLNSAEEPLSGYVSEVSDEEADKDLLDSKKKLSRAGSRNRLANGSSSGPVDRAHSFPVTLVIEEAKVPSVAGGSGVFVSYNSADHGNALRTHVVPVERKGSVAWNYQKECRLAKSLFQQDNKNFMLKMWCRPTPDNASSSMGLEDKLVGVCSVDLAPLAYGFPALEGWYNILDYQGAAQGQMKLSLAPAVPMEAVLAHVNMDKSTTDRQKCEDKCHSSLFTGFSASLSIPYLHGDEDRSQHSRLDATDTSVTEETTSSSTLFTTLKTRLSELDAMTNRLKSRLTNPPPPEEQPVREKEKKDAAPYVISSRLREQQEMCSSQISAPITTGGGETDLSQVTLITPRALNDISTLWSFIEDRARDIQRHERELLGMHRSRSHSRERRRSPSSSSSSERLHRKKKKQPEKENAVNRSQCDVSVEMDESATNQTKVEEIPPNEDPPHQPCNESHSQPFEEVEADQNVACTVEVEVQNSARSERSSTQRGQTGNEVPMVQDEQLPPPHYSTSEDDEDTLSAEFVEVPESRLQAQSPAWTTEEDEEEAPPGGTKCAAVEVEAPSPVSIELPNFFLPPQEFQEKIKRLREKATSLELGGGPFPPPATSSRMQPYLVTAKERAGHPPGDVPDVPLDTTAVTNDDTSRLNRIFNMKF